MRYIIDSTDIDLYKNWAESSKFNSKDRIVTYYGKKYTLIAKKERFFSTPERWGRGFLGVLFVCISLGAVLGKKSFRNLFTKEKETIHFGTYLRPTPEEVKKFEIGSFCYSTYPCGHDCNLILKNGFRVTLNLSAPEIIKYIDGLPAENVTDPWREDNIDPDHFTKFRLETRKNYN